MPVHVANNGNRLYLQLARAYNLRMAKQQKRPEQPPIDATVERPARTGSRHKPGRYMVNVGPFKSLLDQYAGSIEQETELPAQIQDIVHLALRRFFVSKGLLPKDHKPPP